MIKQDHQIARQVTFAAQYLPRDSNQRALFYFLTEQWDKEEISDADLTLLKLLQALINLRLRFDIEVEDALKQIDSGEFALEIE